MLSPSLKQWVEQQMDDLLIEATPVAGGCISECFTLEFKQGTTLFLKTHSSSKLFNAEALALQTINKTVNGFSPEVIAVNDYALLLEYCQPACISSSYWQELAVKLAEMHSKTHSAFGFTSDNFCGATPQPNTWCDDGYDFFAQHRLIYQAEMVVKKGLLSAKSYAKVERLATHLKNSIPEQPAVLLHGDLWSGNCMSTTSGAKLVDPACYFGWAEAELAMTTLFGGFDKLFYQVYESESNIASDWRNRIPIYNLYHLLNHQNLFGGYYRSLVEGILKAY